MLTEIDLKLARRNFNAQRVRARQRDIEWHFKFEEWVSWWGEDIHDRGRTSDKLQMCRYNDQGPYSPANVRKATKAENNREAHLGRTRSLESREKMKKPHVMTKIVSDETRKKMSEAQRSAWQRRNLKKSKVIILTPGQACAP